MEIRQWETQGTLRKIESEICHGQDPKAEPSHHHHSKRQATWKRLGFVSIMTADVKNAKRSERAAHAGSVWFRDEKLCLEKEECVKSFYKQGSVCSSQQHRERSWESSPGRWENRLGVSHLLMATQCGFKTPSPWLQGGLKGVFLIIMLFMIKASILCQALV